MCKFVQIYFIGKGDIVNYIKKVGLIFLTGSFLVLSFGCGINIRDINKTANVSKNEKMVSDTTKLDTSINVGNISVSYGDNSQIIVDGNLSISGNTNNNLADILKSTDIHLVQENKTIYITVVNKNNQENIWDWLKDNKIDDTLSASLKITIPQNINNFSVVTNVGNINLENPTGLINVSSNTGNIIVDNPNLCGASDLQTNVGNVNCSFEKSQNKSGSLNITTNVGGIIISTKNNVKATKQNQGDNFVGSTSQITITDGFVINAETDVGKISIS